MPVNKCGDRLIWFQVEVCEIVFFPPSPNPIGLTITLTCTDLPKARSWLLHAPKLEQQTACFLGHPWHRNAWKYKSKSMQLWSLENVCKKKRNPWQINSKWEPEAAPKGAKASKTSPEVSQRLPESPQKWQRSFKGVAGVDLVVFYNSKWEPKVILEAARASKICPEASQKRPKGV